MTDLGRIPRFAALGFALALTISLGAPSAAEETVIVPKELHSVRAGDVTAHFAGERDEDADPATPIEFFVTHLWFTFGDDPKIHLFRPEGELFFSDWRFDIFSPDGRLVLLLQDRFGPYHLVRIENLPAYIGRSRAPDLVISGNDPAKPAGVHSDAHWLSANEIEYVVTCCGEPVTKRVHVP